VTAPFETISSHLCFNGLQVYAQFPSTVIGLPMRFSLYLPHVAEDHRVPCVLFLAGLTCSEETFMIKAGAQRMASSLGLALLTCDTSPRGANIDGESESWDFGVGAGFYLDATQAPWSRHYKMESHIVQELLPLVAAQFPVDSARVGIMGHSMGGHGALTLAQRHPGRFKSLSAFAPIGAASSCAWGEKAFSRYLGDDRAVWAKHDASLLMRAQKSAPYPHGILVDQGLSDKFLDAQLHPQHFADACASVQQPFTLRMHAGYDHGYFFIQSFVDDHLRFHAERLL
jgi:S-formylglutathione hydrolase